MTKPNTRAPHMMSVAQLAERISVSRKTISRWAEGGLLHVHRLGRQVRISEEDAAAFIAARRE